MKRSSQQILDEWLVTCSQSGDKQALNRLLQRWRPRLLAYAHRQLGDVEAAKDVVQETLLAVTKEIRKLKDVATFPKWCYQILHRRGCDWIAKKQRQRRNDDVLILESVEQDEPGFDPVLQKALNTLDTDHYQTLRLFYLEEFSLVEIAEIIRVPVGTVKSRLFNGRLKLKQYLENQE